MEKFPMQEMEPNIDFLNENIKVTFEIESEAMQALPIVSIENKENELEEFRILLGTQKVNQDGSIHLSIKGIYQETEEAEERSYGEEVRHISYDLVHAKNIIERITKFNPEFKDFNFIGDIHTHPVSSIAKPSEGDLLSIIQAYESGDVKRDEPYIFGIGARHPSGDMEYMFYRIVETDSESGYGYKALD